MKRLFCIAALATMLGQRAIAQGTRVDIDVVASDGATLRATYYSPGKPGPAILLLHQCNMDRKSWAQLGTALAERGIHALAVDYRGYGDSPQAGSNASLTADIDAAFASLMAQPGVNKQHVGVAGASCGVNNAIQLARRSGQLKALLLLSGPTSPDGLAWLRSHPGMAIFAAASSGEAFAVNALREVSETSTNPMTTMRVLEKPGHGTPLFSAEPALLVAVVDWMQAVLR